MENPYDIICGIYNVWHLKVRPNIRKELSFIFENEINEIKKFIQNQEYSRALPLVQTLINGFNPEDYQEKPWGKSAEAVLEKLRGLESFFQEVA